VSFLWSTGETTSTISVSGTGATIAGSVTATDDNGSATDTYSVTFSTAPIVTWNLSASTAGGVTNSSVSGGIGNEQGTQGTAEGISFQSTISPSSGFQWSGTAPTFTISGLPAGVTAGAVVGGTSGTNAASVTVSGTWNPTANVTITVTWTGGGIEAVPPAPSTLSCQILSAGGGALPATTSHGVTVNLIYRMTANFNSPNMTYAIGGPFIHGPATAASASGIGQSISSASAITAGVPLDIPFQITPDTSQAFPFTTSVISAASGAQPSVQPGTSGCSTLVSIPII
jgi:hypothetical protein